MKPPAPMSARTVSKIAGAMNDATNRRQIS